jgi:hypothetical protein
VKQLIQKYQSEAVSLQKLNQLEQVVIPAGEVDEPLAHQPPKLTNATWENGTLTLELDRPVNDGWLQALWNMGNYSSIMGAEPQRFHFNGNITRVSASESAAQAIVDHFKNWLPTATTVYRQRLEAELRQREIERKRALQQQKEAEERNLRVNKSLRI